jgi:hypothetical protein
MVGTLHAIPLPWALVWKLPLARSAFPVRFMVFGYLALAVMVARWLSAPLRRPALRWGLGVLAVAVVIVNIPFITWSQPSPRAALPAFIATGEYRHYLTRGETVLVISARGNAGMLFQAMTNDYFKIAGGFVNQARSATWSARRPMHPTEPVRSLSPRSAKLSQTSSRLASGPHCLRTPTGSRTCSPLSKG